MKKAVMCAVLAVLLGGCAKHNVVSVDGKYTNRWEVVENWNGEKGWIGASRNDDKNYLTFESFNGENAFTLLTFNNPKCKDELVVDGVTYKAKATKKQRGGYSECYIQVFNEDAFTIAAQMAMNDTLSFNGSDVDVRGFEPIMNKFFLKNGTYYNKTMALFNNMQPPSSPMSYTKSGKWKVSFDGRQTIASLASISSEDAAIIIRNDGGNDKNTSLTLSFFEVLGEGVTSCRNYIDINNESFSAKSAKSSGNGKQVCTYVIYGSETNYAMKLLSDKKSSYIDGYVFDTDGLSPLSKQLLM